MEFARAMPDASVPPLWCDFHSCGLSGDPDDNCYYSLHRETLAQLNPSNGTRVFIYDDDVSDTGEPEIFGYTAILEFVSLRGKPWVRARPVPGSWYRGPKPSFWHHGT